MGILDQLDKELQGAAKIREQGDEDGWWVDGEWVGRVVGDGDGGDGGDGDYDSGHSEQEMQDAIHDALFEQLEGERKFDDHGGVGGSRDGQP